MVSPSITVTISKAKDQADKQQDTDSIDNANANVEPDDSVTFVRPETKQQLIDLYLTEPLPINNSVNSKELANVAKQRIDLYQRQQQRNEFFYTSEVGIRPTYLVQVLKNQFVEYEQYQIVKALDQRGILDLDKLDMIWQQIHVVDDLISDIIRLMPAQKPAGWQLTSVNKNHLKLPTVGRLREKETVVADQGSLTSYVLGHFGVMSYTYDRAYYIGHVIGYLFSCYYLAHLSIAYGVTPLPENTVLDYEYASLETAKMVRLLHSVDVHCKRRVYQLAVLCARISCYQLDKYTEKLLIAEVNEFDKKQQIAHLDMLLNKGLMPEMPDRLALKNFPGASGE